MMAVRLTCRSDPVDAGFHVWFYCYIYDTADELRKAAYAYRRSGTAEYWEGTQGCFHPSLSFGVNKRGKYERVASSKFIGVMRLNRENLLPHIVIHECVHAAINYVNVLKISNGYKVGDSNLASEEALCHAAHEFSASLLEKLGMLA